MSINIPQKRVEELEKALKLKQNKLTAGENINIDETDPENPVINVIINKEIINYNETINKPQINSIVLEGNKTAKDLSIFDSTTLIAGKNVTINKISEDEWEIDSSSEPLIPATTNNLGGIKVGTGLSITEDGTLNNDGYSSNDFTTPLKVKLQGIEENANNYYLPAASSNTLGGIKVGDGLSITEDGVLSSSIKDTLTASYDSQTNTLIFSKNKI